MGSLQTPSSNGTNAADLRDLLIKAVEPPLRKTLVDYTGELLYNTDFLYLFSFWAKHHLKGERTTNQLHMPNNSAVVCCSCSSVTVSCFMARYGRRREDTQSQ